LPLQESEQPFLNPPNNMKK